MKCYRYAVTKITQSPGKTKFIRDLIRKLFRPEPVPHRFSAKYRIYPYIRLRYPKIRGLHEKPDKRQPAYIRNI